MESLPATALNINTFYNAQGTAGQALNNVHQPGDGSPLFSFQDATDAYKGQYYTEAQDTYSYNPSGVRVGLLFTAGCNYAVPNTPLYNDCTKACQNSSQIFSNPYTMQNCMLMASLAPISSGSIGHLDDNSADQLKAFNIDVNDTDFQGLANDVYGNISSCLDNFCDSNYGCVDSDVCPWIIVRGVVESANASCFTYICDAVSAPLNGDVGGIGVYISYYMQSGIALGAFLLLKLCHTHFYRTCLLLLWPLCRIWPSVWARSKRRAQSVQTRLQRYLPTIKSATVEFHKAQCFFMLAINIAAQVSVNQGTLNQDTTSLQGLYNNYSLIGVVSISGLLPITFTLLSLHTVGMHSWYLLILSTVTTILSAATFYQIGDFNPSPADVYKLQTATNRDYSGCGDRDPSAFCLDPYQNIISLSLAQRGVGGTAGFTLFILAVLIFDYCGAQDVQIVQRFLRKNLKQLETALQPTKDNRRCYSLARALALIGVSDARSFTSMVSEIIYFIWWFWFLLLFVLFLEKLSYPNVTSIIDSWTFGQIVAIAVWAAPIFELVKLLTQGFKKGLEYRLSHPYRIVNTDKDASDEDLDVRVIFNWHRPMEHEEPFRIF